MTWSVNLSGHVGSESEEADVLEAIQIIVRERAGTIVSGVFDGTFAGTVDLYALAREVAGEPTA